MNNARGTSEIRTRQTTFWVVAGKLMRNFWNKTLLNEKLSTKETTHLNRAAIGVNKEARRRREKNETSTSLPIGTVIGENKEARRRRAKILEVCMSKVLGNAPQAENFDILHPNLQGFY